MKCGIEIHQRLSGGKLFCRCQPGQQAQGAAVSFNRKLHAVRSELGELDSAVRVEAGRERSFAYSSPLPQTCLVEADEEPPHELGAESLRAALVFCQLLSSRPVDELHVMRKNVIDGSNTSGFQRTALIGVGGQVSTPSGKLGIQTICIEEESAGIIEGKEAHAQYDLSRLGIPLVEIATAPDLKSGKQAQEAALAIGTLLRKTGLVQRGIGTIRQDLNVSIPNGARVEIKGVQDLSMVEKTVDLEAARQAALLSIYSEIGPRIEKNPVEAKFVDLTELFSETASQMIGKTVRSGSRVLGMLLPGFSGLLGRETSPGRRFGSELADYARSTGLKGLIHSDEDMGKYGFSDDEMAEIRAALSAGKADAFVLVAGEEKKALSALSEVCCRANFPGVPEETRRANPDGTSSYMRPLPGKARLYPETDLRPIQITAEMISEAKKTAAGIGKKEEEKAKLLSEVNPELAAQLSAARGMISHNASFRPLAATPELSVFAAASEMGADRKFAASVLTNILQSIRREGADTLALDEPRLLAFLSAYKEGKFAKPAAGDLLKAMCAEPALTPEAAVKKAGAEKITGKALQKLISEEKLGFKELMAKYRLRVDAQEASELLKKTGKAD